jgi:uncharacterized repeat protein (TIGR03803 family)
MMSKRFLRMLFCGVLLAASSMLASGAAASAASKVVFNFTGGKDGGNAATDIVFDSAGNAYVTTVVGGKYGCGTVDKLTPTAGSWTPTTLWAFTCFFDGKNPHGGVTLDAQGNIFGTTVAGGGGGVCVGDGCGVVFRISAKTHGERPIYNFTGGRDGFGPGGRVVFDTAGNLYGTTPDGGKPGGCSGQGCGVVYQLSFHHDHWVQTVLHTFTGKNDGAVGSLGPLLISGGSIYGVAELAGANQAGVAYKLSPSSTGWTFSVLYPFKGTPDAGFPYGGLIADANGNLFGTTYFGGSSGNGAIYELMPRPMGHYAERVLYSFSGGADGGNPTTTLVADQAGNLYGTTSAGGGSCGCGVVFKLDALTGTESVLHTFGSTRTDGAYPYYALTPGAGGMLFTATVAGGTFGQGTVFGVTP